MVTGHLLDAAELKADEGQGGAITLIQRFGMGFQGALRRMIAVIAPHERAGLPSVIFVVTYLAMGVPAIEARTTSRSAKPAEIRLLNSLLPPAGWWGSTGCAEADRIAGTGAVAMLSMSAGQMEALGALHAARFVEGCVARLREQHPAAAAAELALKDRVQQLVAQLRGQGFESPGETAYAVELVFRFLFQSDKAPLPADLSAKLQSPQVTVAKKIEALEQIFLFGIDDEDAT